VIEDARILAALDQVLVDFVEHFEERHVGADILCLVLLELTLVLGVLLPPDMQRQVHSFSSHYL
jgi:hypothetical protein